MKLSIKHFNKPSNAKLKLIADIGLYTLPLYNPIIMAMPLNPSTISWLLSISNTLVVGFKVFTKFTSEEQSDVNNNTNNTPV